MQKFINRFESVTAELEVDAVQRLNTALDAAYKQLEIELRRQYPQLASSGSLMVSKDAILRMEKLKRVLVLLNPETAAELEKSFQQILRLANQAGETLASQLTEARNSETWAVKPGEIPIEAAGFAARNTVEHLNRYAMEFRTNATTIVTQGVVQGWGTAKVAQLLRNQLGITKGKAELIARTEVLSSFNSAVVASFENAGVDYVQVIATGDLRTCGLCVARNLKVYRINDISVPLHPNCRCTLIPWFENADNNDTWARKFYKTVRDGFEGNLNNGLSPFEKMNGYQKPPVAVWTPKTLK